MTNGGLDTTSSNSSPATGSSREPEPEAHPGFQVGRVQVQLGRR